jgi:hypothetical protein
MSTTRVERVGCPGCGALFPASLAESANATRHPPFRQQVLEGTFMRFTCPTCAAPVVVERELLYTDLARGTLIAVFPSALRVEGHALEPRVRATLDSLGADPANAARVQLRRLVFGYAELREKVIQRDAGLDDRVTEALKLVVRDGLLDRPAGLLLVEVGEVLTFLRLPDHTPIQVPRAWHTRLAAELAGGLGGLLPIPPDALWVSADRHPTNASTASHNTRGIST